MPAPNVLALSEDREMRQQWQRACELLLAEADVGALSKQIELALFYDGRLATLLLFPSSFFLLISIAYPQSYLVIPH